MPVTPPHSGSLGGGNSTSGSGSGSSSGSSGSGTSRSGSGSGTSNSGSQVAVPPAAVLLAPVLQLVALLAVGLQAAAPLAPVLQVVALLAMALLAAVAALLAAALLERHPW